MNFRKLILAIVVLAFSSTAALAVVSPGDLNRLRGLAMTLVSATITTLTSTAATITTLTSTTANITTGTVGALTVSSTIDTHGMVFGTGITGNPLAKVVYGSCTVAAVNGGTCIPLIGVASRTISVLNFDIVAAGSAATCTGIILEDTNSAPVVIATLAAATLTSGGHNAPLAATLGAGFGAGSGLTAAKGVQIIKNGSDCGTTTAFQYAITYVVQ